MLKFIAYIDFIAYTDFQLETPKNYVEHRVRQVVKDLQDSFRVLEEQQVQSLSSISVFNISDTLVLWTADDSIESLRNLLKLVYEYNKRSITFGFPHRGSVVYGEVENAQISSQVGDSQSMNINVLKGKGLVEAERKVENLIWAGMVIDPSIEAYLHAQKLDVEQELLPFSIRYQIPYEKTENISAPEEYCFRLSKSQLAAPAIHSLKGSVENNFSKIHITNFTMKYRSFLQNTLTFIDFSSK